MGLRSAVLFLAAAAGLAQPPAGQKPASVEGTVLNSVTGAPLRKVELSLANGEMPQELAAMVQQFKPGGQNEEMPSVATKTVTAATDAQGRFRFENVPPGTYWLTAKKVGYGDGAYPAGGGSLRLSPGQELQDADFRLVPNATLSGRVLDEDGEPFPTAMVSALKVVYMSGRRRLVPVDAAQSNNKGEYSLTKVPPGRYFLCADAMRMAFGQSAPPPPADGSPEMAYVGTYLPGVLDPAEAEKIDVAAGAELSGFNIQLRKSKVVRVSGRLTDADGQPIKTAQVMLMAGGGRIGGMSMTMVSDPQGRFELTNLQPGAYTAMTIQMQGSAPKMTMTPLIVPDKNLENVVLGARRDIAVRGQVVVDGDAKVPVRRYPISLTAADGMAVMPAFAYADESGAFTLEHVAPASYDLNLPFRPDGTYVKSVVFNDRESLGQPLDCTAIPSATLRVVLGTDAAAVEAQVSRDDKPAAGAKVVLLPADPNRRSPLTVRTGSTDRAGKLQLSNVPPGDYVAFAWENAVEGAWFDPDFVKAAGPDAVKLQVRPRGSEKLELKLIRGSAPR